MLLMWETMVDIVGIGTSAVGINTTGPALFFELKPDSTIFPANINSPTSKERLKTGITTGDYFCNPKILLSEVAQVV